MPDGNAAIKITLTTEYPDPTNAELDWFSVSDGNVIQGTVEDGCDYLVTVPYDSEENFEIYAQAKNPKIKPGLTLTNPTLGGVDSEVTLGEPIKLTEGLNEYTVTVTSEDGNTANEYKIKVIKLPNLSLKTFQVTTKNLEDSSDFTRDLVQLAKQNVYVPYVSITVVAEAADDSGATVDITPFASVYNLNATGTTAVTVTVRKEIPYVNPIYTTASYVLDLCYGKGMAVSPAAEGGYVSFIPGGGGIYYEVHTFSTEGTYTLSFSGGTESIMADVFVVAGGGGCGGDNATINAQSDFPGGGGAGGLLYKTDYQLTLLGGSVSVVVGTGGSGGTKQDQGKNGGDSWIGTNESNAQLKSPGGGGGGGAMANMDGLSGGSGGGGGSGGSTARGSGGTAKSITDGTMGNNGGAGAGFNASMGIDGGGGGATGDGGSASGDFGINPGEGGAGWRPNISPETAWICDVTGMTEFSHGGRGGGRLVDSRANGANYGDGGSGGNNNQSSGGGGHSGIVIIRFQRTPETPLQG